MAPEARATGTGLVNTLLAQPLSQLVLALKTLCGFDIREIAERLFTTDANVYKRLARARSRLRDAPFEPDT